jgi:hypothetical protein
MNSNPCSRSAASKKHDMIAEWKGRFQDNETEKATATDADHPHQSAYDAIPLPVFRRPV